MKNENAIELLKIANELACTIISNKSTMATKGGADAKTVFADCVKEVKAHFDELTSSK